ncbi:hypothetical protein Agub_g12701, partial [Astrephomene gubernaculifera]
PGVSAGVPDYLNVLHASAITRTIPVPGCTTNTAGDDACRTGREDGTAGTAGGGGGAVSHTPPLSCSWVATAAAGVATSAELWFRQYQMLVWREWLMATRNPADVAGRMLTFVWVGLFSNFLTYNFPTDATNIALRANLLFALVFFFIVMPFVFMSLFTADKRFFLLEASARGGGGGLYAPSAYYAAKVTATAPFNIIIALTFDLIGYGMLGMRHSVVDCVRHATCSALMALISMQWVQAAVAFSPNQDIAFIASVAFSVVNLLFSSMLSGSCQDLLPLDTPPARHLRPRPHLARAARGVVPKPRLPVRPGGGDGHAGHRCPRALLAVPAHQPPVQLAEVRHGATHGQLRGQHQRAAVVLQDQHPRGYDNRLPLPLPSGRTCHHLPGAAPRSVTQVPQPGAVRAPRGFCPALALLYDT